jgi:hypothetical protein
MNSNNIEDGIAISILLSEISEISNRILTYDQKRATWISLENQPTLSLHDKKRQILNHTIISQYKKTYDQKKKNTSTLAIEYIIKSILETKLSIEKIENMVLVFISDFASIDSSTESLRKIDKETDHYSLIQNKFRENGISKIPNIIYWNISTEMVRILPCSPITPNVIFLAGTASSNFQHLFDFYKSTTESRDEKNPFSYYKKILNQEKYKPFERYLYQCMI